MSTAGRLKNNGLNGLKLHLGLEIKRTVFPELSIVIDFLIEVEKFPSLAVFENTSYKHLSGTIYT